MIRQKMANITITNLLHAASVARCDDVSGDTLIRRLSCGAKTGLAGHATVMSRP